MKKHIIAIFTAVLLGATAPCATVGAVRASVEPTEATVKVANGIIELSVTSEEPVRFQIYSITGQLVKTVEVSRGSVSVELPRGYYIVKCDKWSRQVVVR